MTPHEQSVLDEQALSDARIVDGSIVGTIEQADPADIMLVCGYFANLPNYHVDWVYKRNGKTYVDVSMANREAFDPPDVITYEFALVERNSQGHDVEAISLTEVAWADATKRYLRGEEP